MNTTSDIIGKLQQYTANITLDNIWYFLLSDPGFNDFQAASPNDEFDREAPNNHRSVGDRHTCRDFYYLPRGKNEPTKSKMAEWSAESNRASTADAVWD